MNPRGDHQAEESKNIEDTQMNGEIDNALDNQEEEIQYDENQITDVVSRFFMQNSETRLKYMNGFKDLLQANLKKQVNDLQNELHKANGQEGNTTSVKKENRDDILDNSQDEIDVEAVNPPAEFIEIVLQYIYNIYITEYEQKKNSLPLNEQEQIKVEDVFDENDKKLIEDLQDFMEQYQVQKI